MSARQVLAIALSLIAAAAIPSGCSRPAELPTPASEPAESNTALASPTPTLDPLERLQRGASPRLAFALGAGLHSPGTAGTIRLRARHFHGLTSVVSYADGWLVTPDTSFEGTVPLVSLAADGTRRRDLGTTSAGARLDPRTGTVCWTTFAPPESLTLTPTVVTCGDPATGAERSQEVGPDLAMPEVIGFHDGRPWLGGRFSRGGRQTWLTDLAAPPVPSGIDDLLAISPNGSLGVRWIGGRGIAAVDLGDGRELWRHPMSTLGLPPFSPDDRYVAGRHRRAVVIADSRTGREVTRTEADLPGVRFLDAAWEDAEHLLVAYAHRRAVDIVRIGVDGRSERAGRTLRAARPPALVFVETPPDVAAP